MTLRNNLHRRNHKERGQLKHREKLGFLEKHKDYVLRARDYHSKQDRLTRLRQKAAKRNKDEFYFSMNREKTRVSIAWCGMRGMRNRECDADRRFAEGCTLEGPGEHVTTSGLCEGIEDAG